MPIQVKRDIKRRYKFGKNFSLKDIPNFKSGSVLNRVRADIADQNWNDFHSSWGVTHADREIAKILASKFNFNYSEADTFDQLWDFIREARAYKDKEKDGIHADLITAYRYVAQIASGLAVDKQTFKRTITRSDANFVVFSDFHMTAFRNKPNYFKEYNYQLYLDVLNYYARLQPTYCLIENGDVEECLIYEPTLSDAKLRRAQAPNGFGIDEIKYPVRLNEEKWGDFLKTRYKARENNLINIIATFPEYYDRIRNNFIARNKYVRLIGNHDTYLDDFYEKTLRDRIHNELGMEVKDVLKIVRNGTTDYVVLHGHQFDSVCQQHGAIPYAKSLGEIYSECLSWAYQGPDRVWKLNDTKNWYIGNSYNNVLAKEEAGIYQGGTKGIWDLLFESLDRIKQDSKDFVETLLGHEIAWEYFENTTGFNALTLEVWTGDELYKMRHMNEVDLCEFYAAEYLLLNPGLHVTPPTLILGHTHEPRKNAVFPNASKAAPTYYLNSGSAGRYENLIWCVEIEGNADRICSWSQVNGQLKKITWKSAGNQLVHDAVQMISV